MSNYYTKYLKYKNKYLNLKNQTGGPKKRHRDPDLVPNPNRDPDLVPNPNPNPNTDLVPEIPPKKKFKIRIINEKDICSLYHSNNTGICGLVAIFMIFIVNQSEIDSINNFKINNDYTCDSASYKLFPIPFFNENYIINENTKKNLNSFLTYLKEKVGNIENHRIECSEEDENKFIVLVKKLIYNVNNNSEYVLDESNKEIYFTTGNFTIHRGLNFIEIYFIINIISYFLLKQDYYLNFIYDYKIDKLYCNNKIIKKNSIMNYENIKGIILNLPRHVMAFYICNTKQMFCDNSYIIKYDWKKFLIIVNFIREENKKNNDSFTDFHIYIYEKPIIIYFHSNIKYYIDNDFNTVNYNSKSFIRTEFTDTYEDNNKVINLFIIGNNNLEKKYDHIFNDYIKFNYYNYINNYKICSSISNIEIYHKIYFTELLDENIYIINQIDKLNYLNQKFIIDYTNFIYLLAFESSYDILFYECASKIIYDYFIYKNVLNDPFIIACEEKNANFIKYFLYYDNKYIINNNVIRIINQILKYQNNEGYTGFHILYENNFSDLIKIFYKILYYNETIDDFREIKNNNGRIPINLYLGDLYSGDYKLLKIIDKCNLKLLKKIANKEPINLSKINESEHNDIRFINKNFKRIYNFLYN
jgi:hypothetical protein